jgi:hypothetical protein
MEIRVLFGRFDGGRTNGTPLHCWFIDFCDHMVYFWLVHDHMKTRLITLFRAVAIAVPLCGVIGDYCYGQEASRESLAISPDRYQVIFEDVEEGISTGNVSHLAKYFAPKVAISLRGDESGTFSSNQTYYVLQNFFKARRFRHFAFSTIGESDANPYASGSVEFIHKGAREVAQLYVALTFVGERYVITQMAVY